jgi:N-acetylglutamate synthase-like GNAT family acetyltransferase
MSRGMPRSVSALTVRDARPDDRNAMRELLAELGYPSEPSTIDSRLERLGAEPSARILVAERDRSLVGLASLHVLHLIERPPLGRLSAIVVTRPERRMGVGLALLERVEDEARAAGCDRLEVTSGEWRDDAHAFYRALGFEETSKRFIKAI